MSMESTEKSITPEGKEAYKIERLYSDTSSSNDILRAEAYDALKREGVKISQDPEFKNAVINIVQTDMDGAVSVERDKDGNPQALTFKCIKQNQDELKLSDAIRNNDDEAAENLRTELIKDCYGVIDVPTLSPGQEQPPTLVR